MKKRVSKKKVSNKAIKKVSPRANELMMIRRRLPKLVRDNVPDCIVKDNLVPVFHFAPEAEYLASLQGKLLEEFEELMEPDHFEKFMKGDYSELADVLDVIDHLLKAGTGSATHVGHPDVAASRTIKARLKGSFTKQIVLEDIIDRSELR